MSCPVDQQSLEKLKQFVNFVKLQPDILLLPELSFLKDFIESFGGTVPECKMSSDSKTEHPPDSFKEDDIESEPESELELDMTGCIEADKLNSDQKMGDWSKEVSEEDADGADEKRREATAEFSTGNYEKAIILYTEAIEINPNSALMFAKRGQTYLKLNKPNACIKDCSRALELNPDSATAYKFRGRSYRLIGDFESAAKDLRQACKIDFDEQTDEWLKEVTPNAKKIEEHLLKKERKRKDKEEKERLERIRKAKEAHAKTASTHPEPDNTDTASAPGGMPSMGDFYKLLQDPDIMNALKDPEISAAFQDISKNPANMFKYKSNPKIQELLSKMSNKFSGSDFSGFPGGFPFGGGKPAQTGDDNLD